MAPDRPVLKVASSDMVAGRADFDVKDCDGGAAIVGGVACTSKRASPHAQQAVSPEEARPAAASATEYKIT